MGTVVTGGFAVEGTFCSVCPHPASASVATASESHAGRSTRPLACLRGAPRSVADPAPIASVLPFADPFDNMNVHYSLRLRQPDRFLTRQALPRHTNEPGRRAECRLGLAEGSLERLPNDGGEREKYYHDGPIRPAVCLEGSPRFVRKAAACSSPASARR